MTMCFLVLSGNPYLILSIYDEIYQEQDGTYKTTGCNRTGCVFCMFGCHLEKGENLFQRLVKMHPKLYNYCMNGVEEVNGVWQPNNKGLGLAKVLDYIGVDYTPHKLLKSKKLF